jgi:hypothetical protein
MGTRPQGAGQGRRGRQLAAYDTVGGEGVLTVVYDAHATDLASQQTEMDEVARAVWTKAPVRFDELRLVPDGEAASCSRARCSRDAPGAYGPRAAALDRRQAGRGMVSDLLATGLVVVVLLAIALLVVSGIAGRWRGSPPNHEPSA